MFASFKLRLAAYFVVLAVLPLGAAFWGFSSVLERAEEQRVDSRLEAELRAATAAYTRELAGRTDSARRLAQSAPLQRALERRDRAAISRLLRGGRGVRVV